MKKVTLKEGMFHHFFQLLRPKLLLGGLELSDAALTYILINTKDGSLQKASVRLEQGVVVNGVITEAEKFRKHLRQLHHLITHRRSKKIPIILSVADKNIYTQRFTLPPLKQSEMKEAVKLNLQTISPVDFEKAYYDWEWINESKEIEEKEILASFVEKETIDVYVKTFENENFFVMAVEQKATSLVRTITTCDTSFVPEKTYLVMMANSEGISSIIIRNETVYFSRFSEWSAVGNLQEGFNEKQYRDFIVRDFNQVSNFFVNKFHAQFDAVYIVANTFTELTMRIMKENFSIEARTLQLQEQHLEEPWFVAFGAALRGKIPFSQDMQISLAPQGTEALYRNMQLRSFLSLWTGIFASVSFILLVAFLGVFIFLNSYISNLVAVVTSSFDDPQVIAQYEMYTGQAQKFNTSVQRALEVQAQYIKWGKLLDDVSKSAGNSVIIDRFYMQAKEMPVNINGRALTEQAANDFRNKLMAIPYIQNVDLPLSSFQKADAQYVSFRLTFSLKDLNF